MQCSASIIYEDNRTMVSLLKKGDKIVSLSSYSTAVSYYCYEKTGTWWTTKDGQGCHHLPPTATVSWGGTHFLANAKPDTTSALDFRISLVARDKSPST